MRIGRRAAGRGNNARRGCRPTAAHWSCRPRAQGRPRRTRRSRAQSRFRSDRAADNRSRCRPRAAAAARSASDGVRLRTMPDGAPGQQNHRRKPGDPERGAAASAPAFGRGTAVRQIATTDRKSATVSANSAILSTASSTRLALGEPREGKQRPVPEIQRIGNPPEESDDIERRRPAPRFNEGTPMPLQMNRPRRRTARAR